MAKTKVTAATILGRITYTSIYVFLCTILAVLLLVVPADIVRQILNHTYQRANILVLTIAYVLTFIIVIFVYALRLYTNRTVLASIPKLWIPIEKSDVNKQVRAVIVASLGRSAAIAWEARPKVLSSPEVDEGLDIIIEATNETPIDTLRTSDEKDHDGGRQIERKRGFPFRHCLGRRPKKKPATTIEDEMGIALPPVRPVWGHVEHDGWESPNSPDLPNLQYATVLAELPHLIEAKAVSLAPPEPQSPTVGSLPVLDPEAVAVLQRAANMSMRDYITHLVSLRMLPSDTHDLAVPDEAPSSPIASEFLDAYERARFSTRPMPKVLFRTLMHLFAELLRLMRPPDPSALYGDEGSDGFADDGYSARLYGGDGVSVSDSDGHIDDDAPRDGTPTTPTRSLDFSFSDSLRSGSIPPDHGDQDTVRSDARSSHSRRGRQAGPPRLSTREPSQRLIHRDIRDRNRDRDGHPSSTNTRHHQQQPQQQQYRTAPTTPMSRRWVGNGNTYDAASSFSQHSVSSESIDTFARTKRPYPATSSSSSGNSIMGGASLRSFSSGRSRASGASGSQQGSVVIRLARPEDGDEARGLPYVLRIGGGEP